MAAKMSSNLLLNLPDDIQGLIWRKYFSNHIIDGLENHNKTLRNKWITVHINKLLQFIQEEFDDIDQNDLLDLISVDLSSKCIKNDIIRYYLTGIPGCAIHDPDANVVEYIGEFVR